MSEYIFKLPDLGEGTVESEISEWFIKVGDLIEEETIVGTVMTGQLQKVIRPSSSLKAVEPVSLRMKYLAKT